MRLSVFIPGIPITQGSKRQVPVKGGRTVMIEDKDKELKAWRKVVAFHVLAARQKAGAWPKPDDEKNRRIPYKLSVIFVLPRPEGDMHDSPAPIPLLPAFRVVRRSKPVRPTRKPDMDKLIRAIADAVKSTAWADDCQMVDIEAYKLHGQGVVGALVCIDEVDPMKLPPHVVSMLQQEGFSVVGADVVSKG